MNSSSLADGRRPRAQRFLAVVVGTAALLAASVIPVSADGPPGYTDWGAPQPVVTDPGVPADQAVNTAAHDGCPIESPDGLQLWIASPRPGSMGKNDIWVAERPNKNAAWGPMVNVGGPVNTEYHDFCPTPLGGGWLLFVSDRPACGADPTAAPPAPSPVGDIYITRQRSNGSWTTPQHLGCVADGTGPNFAGGEFGPSLVAGHGGVYLYFSSSGPSGGPDQDIYRSRLGWNGRFGTPERIEALSTVGFVDQMPNLTRNGREIVFASNRGGNMDIWTATMSRSGQWSDPVPVAAVNSSLPESRPSISGDGTRLYFGRGNPADVYVSMRSPIGHHDEEDDD